jgi:pyruvate dehydrogenase phosphatase
MIFKQNLNNKKYKTVGACALTAIVLKDSIHVANAGDCEGIIVGKFKSTKTNNRLNAGEPEEQDRLYKAFPHEKDIIKCIKNTNYCYVKGRLQPTRSLGDFYLKHPEYNFTNLSVFTGPYIDYKPQVSHFKRLKDDRYLILATDGMWDELNDEEVERISKNHQGQRLVDGLFSGCLYKINERNNTTLERLEKMHERRDLHDDISIIAVDLHKLNEAF